MNIFNAFRNFREKRKKSAIAKNQKIVTNPKAIREDRVEAIDYFCELKEASVAVPALLARFNYSLEHGINDTREKESAMEGITKFKDEAIPLIALHVKSTDRIAWPIKCLKKIADESTQIAILESCLDYGDIAFDQGKVDKNYDVLCYLREYQLNSELCKKILHFLAQHDERVRFATVELLIEQKHPEISGQVEPFILDGSSENTRIRQSVVQAFIKNRWQIKQKDRFAVGLLMPGVLLTKDYHLQLA